MDTNTLMNRIMNSLDELHKEARVTGERIIHVEDTVKRHDIETFPAIRKELENQSNALFRMESKQNADISRFISEKNLLIDRIKPLEQDYIHRMTEEKTREDNKKETKRDIKKKLVDTIWDWMKLIVVAIVTWLITYNK